MGNISSYTVGSHVTAHRYIEHMNRLNAASGPIGPSAWGTHTNHDAPFARGSASPFPKSFQQFFELGSNVGKKKGGLK